MGLIGGWRGISTLKERGFQNNKYFLTPPEQVVQAASGLAWTVQPIMEGRGERLCQTGGTTDGVSAMLISANRSPKAKILKPW